MNYPYTETDLAQIRGARHKHIVGTPQQVKEEILNSLLQMRLRGTDKL
ncbi:hypothetical protein GK047_03585 [Paenibacillus sp. SYP-B3998]|uniref:Uncharacterized protein n=1 Tax=Paenibacillus sp. SYP-B3998 TaxID=2678564 RepID=A0A6G3ZSI4_9BACL|nr:hypothetical protein [Paenibacillus sp. SYP-B3998]NEW05102.1 hypothetical protein [Paenibacillus sp. SYP-B3998]